MEEERTVDEILEEEIKDELKELRSMEVGSENYKVAVDGITKNKLTGASIGVPALVTISGTALMLWYEIGKDGLISSLAGKGIIQRLIGRK